MATSNERIAKLTGLQKTIAVLVMITLLQGVATVFVISSLVPIFVVGIAIFVLIFYVLALLWFLKAGAKRKPAFLISVLSLFTLLAPLSTEAHVRLIQEGYLPAIVIIFSGAASQSVLLALSLLSLRRTNTIVRTDV